MTFSDYPTNPPPKLRTVKEVKKERWFERLQKGLHVLYVIGGAIISAAVWGYANYQLMATDTEVALAIEKHNQSAYAHSSTTELLRELLKEQRELKEMVARGRADDVALGERLVSLIAADREQDRYRRAQTATFYREEYRRLVRKGENIEDALLEALRTPLRR